MKEIINKERKKIILALEIRAEYEKKEGDKKTKETILKYIQKAEELDSSILIASFERKIDWIEVYTQKNQKNKLRNIYSITKDWEILRVLTGGSFGDLKKSDSCTLVATIIALTEINGPQTPQRFLEIMNAIRRWQALEINFPKNSLNQWSNNKKTINYTSITQWYSSINSLRTLNIIDNKNIINNTDDTNYIINKAWEAMNSSTYEYGKNCKMPGIENATIDRPLRNSKISLSQQQENSNIFINENIHFNIEPFGETQPMTHTISILRYTRDKKVMDYVFNHANGICENCKQPAPFRREDKSPYLEIHHLTPLADGGADTVENCVALCPNCHRSLHSAENKENLKENLISQKKNI